MLRKFRIKINDNEYLVEMEELTPTMNHAAQTDPVESMNPAPVTPPPASPKQQPAQTSKSATVENGQKVVAPMPGNILDIRVKEGQQVAENQVVAILEAMKMENEIVAPKAGTIRSVLAQKGKAIDVGQTIVIID